MQLRPANVPAPARGSAAVPFVIALPVMLGMMALALDLSYRYTRKSELQQIADSMALAAARELNGTTAGVSNAVSKLSFSAADHYYAFMTARIGWDPSAVSFAASPDATDWKEAGAVGAEAAQRVFARVDTSKLNGSLGAPGVIDTLFATILGAAAQDSLSAQAVAGPASVQVLPLAVCALDPDPAALRVNPGAASETTEYGFRRGVSYNLLDLSPVSTTPQAYLVNPLDSGTATNNTVHFGATYVKQFFCNGTMAFQRVVAGSKLHITPLALDITDWLNSRFNDFTTGDACNRNFTPVSDSNIREYIGKQGGTYANWYIGSADSYPRTAASTNRTPTGGRVTFADLKAGESGNTPAFSGPESFGPLWTYNKPIPVGVGALPFTSNDWARLYTFGGQSPSTATAGNYPATTPYLSSAHSVSVLGGTKDRRVLNIPLLSCPGGNPGSPATVIGIGRFFMTAKATAAPASVPGEFAGLAQSGIPTGSVVLYK
jgi:Flp pilus assembly protein TadG